VQSTGPHEPLEGEKEKPKPKKREKERPCLFFSFRLSVTVTGCLEKKVSFSFVQR
jgi:hypothetical protein